VNFHSVEFLVFLAIVLPLFWALANRRNARHVMLLVASYIFYGSYELWYLSLIVGSTALDWYCGNAIQRARERGDSRGMTFGLMASLGGNLGLLAFFKYTDWLIGSLQSGAAWLGLDVDLWGLRRSVLPDFLLDSDLVRILVPVGISFYTFQTLSYTIDIYRGHLKPARNLLEIVRAVTFLPQFELRPRYSRERVHDGLWRITTGLLKKVAIADVLGGYLVDPVYADPGNFTPAVHMLALYGFAFQIYFDFSGYSDIAIGTSKLLGFDLPENFLTPYRSRSVREFWRRWHISLSSWVRDYIFFPLGGSRGREGRVARNLLITMFLIGIWHGASILWAMYGILQGSVMILERAMERWRGGAEFATTRAKSLVSWALTFHFIVFSCLFIRARDMGELVGMLTDYGAQGVGSISEWAWYALVGGALTHFWSPRITEGARRAFVSMPTLAIGLLVGIAAGCVAVLVVGDTPYIYFQF
jgi:alginate O-acetyltransferase complex protein AlgI